MRLLCIGDVFGSPGRKAIRQLLPGLIEELEPEAIIVNGENAAGGSGLTVDTAKDLLAQPIDVLTGGNHTWRYREVGKLLEAEPRILRPLNYPDKAPGRGYTVCQGRSGAPIGVLNLQGRVFMDPLPCPFRAADEAIDALRAQGCKVIVVDFHAEATSEKRALGWHLDGRVSVLFGTHTHVPTADEEVLPQGTAYITDLGMTGPYDSCIGVEKEKILERFLTMRPTSFSVAKGDVRLCGIVVDVDSETGRATRIERLQRRI